MHWNVMLQESEQHCLFLMQGAPGPWHDSQNPFAAQYPARQQSASFNDGHVVPTTGKLSPHRPSRQLSHLDPPPQLTPFDFGVQTPA